MDPIGLTFEMYDHVGSRNLKQTLISIHQVNCLEQEIKMGPLQMPLSLHTV